VARTCLGAIPARILKWASGTGYCRDDQILNYPGTFRGEQMLNCSNLPCCAELFHYVDVDAEGLPEIVCIQTSVNVKFGSHGSRQFRVSCTGLGDDSFAELSRRM